MAQKGDYNFLNFLNGTKGTDLDIFVYSKLKACLPVEETQ